MGRRSQCCKFFLGGCICIYGPCDVCGQVVARCKEDILAAKGVKPTLSPNLNVLATVEALDVKRLLFIGVGCQASCFAVSQALHASAAVRGPG